MTQASNHETERPLSTRSCSIVRVCLCETLKLTHFLACLLTIIML